MAERLLDANKRAWEEKPSLRAVYHDLYRRIAAACAKGATLEIGGGTGNLKAYAPHVVATDIQTAPWLDAVCDAHHLPFADRVFSNVVLFDVLHHLARPALFFTEAERVLRPGGRIVMVEPAITPMSWLFYHWLHPEPVRMGEDPLAAGAPPADRDPYDANQAFPSLLFGPSFMHHGARFRAMFPHLAVREARPMSLFAYPMTGGFRPWSLIPEAAVAPVLAMERMLAPVLGPLCAFRVLVVLERI